MAALRGTGRASRPETGFAAGWRRAVALVGALLLLLLLLPWRTQAATLIIVDRFDDDPSATACTAVAPNDCSLRGAIINTNNALGPDTITLPAGTYTLDEVGTGEGYALDGDLDIRGELVINGAGQATTIIDGNGAVTGENVFTIDGSTSAEFNDLTVTGGGGTVVGGIIAFGGLTLNSVTIDSNVSTGSGGGIHSISSLSLSNSTVSNNSGSHGGGIYIHSGSLAISSSTITGNVATSGGGGIYINGGTATIDTSSHVDGNSASVGAGININAGTLTISDSQVNSNSCTSNGGGFYIGSAAAVTLNATGVTMNSCSGPSGGGVVLYGTLETHSADISLNSAVSTGGGLEVNSGATAELFDSTVSNNYVSGDPSSGGGIYNSSGDVTLDGVTLQSNYVSGTATSSSYGGGIYSYSGTLTLTDSKILDNTGIDTGGGVYTSNGTLTITNSIFRGNSVTGDNSVGGGLFNASSATLKQVEFSGNSAVQASGGIHTQAGMVLENATISGNSAPYGPGLFSTGPGTTSILNSTISGNHITSGTSPGGLEAYNDVTITNSIIAGNDNDQCWNDSGSSITSNGYNISSDSSCGFGASGDQPNTDPLLGPLADNGGFSQTHALLPGSPALDAGTNSGCPATDQRGVNRPIDGDSDGTAVCDIGAYEALISLFLPLIMR